MARRDRILKAPIRPRGMEPVDDTEFRAIVDRLVRELRPEKVVLFGSYAYGDPTPDSDVDLLVVLDSDAPYEENFLAVSRLLRPRPFPVDILVRTPKEIREALASGDFFIQEILSQGRILYDRGK